MKILHLKILLGIVLVWNISACSFTSAIGDEDSPDIVSKNEILSVVQSDSVSLYQVILIEKEGGAVVTGKVRMARAQELSNGHIDVNIESASGKSLYSTSVKIDRHITHEHHRENHPHFHVELHQAIPAGAKVLVSYHRDAQDPVKASVCDEPHCG